MPENQIFYEKRKPILHSISFVLHNCIISGSWDIEHLDSI
jgi:hypothetical protein